MLISFSYNGVGSPGMGIPALLYFCSVLFDGKKDGRATLDECH
jgi:hypothetical protein